MSHNHEFGRVSVHRLSQLLENDTGASVAKTRETTRRSFFHSVADGVYGAALTYMFGREWFDPRSALGADLAPPKVRKQNTPSDSSKQNTPSGDCSSGSNCAGDYRSSEAYRRYHNNHRNLIFTFEK